MKWMGWSWDELLACPVSVRDEIVTAINEEADELASR